MSLRMFKAFMRSVCFYPIKMCRNVAEQPSDSFHSSRVFGHVESITYLGAVGHLESSVPNWTAGIQKLRFSFALGPAGATKH